MPALYDRFPLKFKLPEQNGGKITEQDAFPGMVYYTSDTDVILSGGFSSVFSSKFNVYSSSLAPRLIKYIPSLDVFSFTFYKGIYLYNPSIEEDNVSYETSRDSIIFSATGGTSFIAGSSNSIFFEGNYYSSDVNKDLELNGVNRTSLNDNVDVYASIGRKNEEMPYFDIDGSYPGGNIGNLDYSISNTGFNIPDLLPGEYVPIFLRFDIKFSLDSNPVDYIFLNLSYNNIENLDYFGSRETIPGASLVSNLNDVYYNQSFSLRFDTNLSNIKNLIDGKVRLLYDNYPPFFHPLDIEPTPPVIIEEEVVRSFISTWSTSNLSSGSSSGNQISLPLVASGSYSFTVDWGDGSVDYITSYSQSERTHTYNSSGVYTIKIDGLLSGWSFNNSGDKLKILNISQFGILQIGTDPGAFYGCTNLTITAEDNLNTTLPTNFNSIFRNSASLVSIPSISSWNVLNVSDMSMAFSGASSFTGNIGGWDTSSVTNMSGMFYNASSFNVDITDWDVSNVTTMENMFRGTKFNQNISKWDYSGLNQSSSLDNFFVDSTGLTSYNYDPLLQKWDSYTSGSLIQTPMTVNMGVNTPYSEPFKVYRDSLIAYGWTIIDGGLGASVTYKNEAVRYKTVSVRYV